MRPTVPSLTAAKDGLGRVAWWLAAPLGLMTLYCVAFLVRVLVAPHAGFGVDVADQKYWAVRLADVGPRRFYAPGVFADYPPAYLYLLWPIGEITRALDPASLPSHLFIKLPSMLADLGLAWVASELALRITPPGLARRVPVRPLVAAAVLFNPAVLAVGALWGQVDVIPAFFLVWSMLLLFTREQTLQREIAGIALLALAFAVKPQTAVALPAPALAFWWRHLRGRWRDWPRLRAGAVRLAILGAVAFAVWAAPGIPFGLGPAGLVRQLRSSASVYPVTSAWAFNLWGALGFWRNDSVGDAVLEVFGVPALYVGFVLILSALGVVLVAAHRALRRGTGEALVVIATSCVTSGLAFALLTRMHERYLFTTLAVMAPLVMWRTWRRAFAVLSALFVVNLYFPYVYYRDSLHADQFRIGWIYDLLYGGDSGLAWQKKLLSLVVLAVILTIAWRGLRWLAATIAGRPEAAEPAYASAHGLPADRMWETAPAAGAPAVRPASPAPVPAATARSRWGWRRTVPPVLVALVLVFNLVALRGEVEPAQNLNDSSLHLQMVRWARGQIDAGRIPLDGWYPFHALGSAHFHHYQSLPHILTAYLSLAFGVNATYLWALYLLLALWPLCVYWSARLLGWGPWAAAAAAVVSPFIVSQPGYGYEAGSYVWKGYGVYSQEWAMWLLPLSWALTWRAVARKESYAHAAGALALTIACHFITGYLALLSVGVWVLLAPSELVRRLSRAVIVAVGSLLVSAWVIVPLLADSRWTNRSVFYEGTFFYDSYGAKKVLGWLLTGQLFDSGRAPIVSLLLAVGFVVCLARFRRDERARALLGVWTLSLLLFFGRPTLGPLLELLPGMGDVQIHRFIVGVHLSGIFIAGVGGAWLLGRAVTPVAWLVERMIPPPAAGAATAAGLVGLTVACTVPMWTQLGAYDRSSADLIERQQFADDTDGRDVQALIDRAKDKGGGRLYAGLRANWGNQYRVGDVPVHARLANSDADMVGFPFRTVASLSTDIEGVNDDSNPGWYRALNIRYLILPSDRQPPVPAKFLDSRGRHTLWVVDTSGYLQVVDTSGPPIEADRTNLEPRVIGFLRSQQALGSVYPTIAFAGARPPAPTTLPGIEPTGPPGVVDHQVDDGARDGIYAGQVTANRDVVVVLKSSYHPRWKASVDGVDVPTQMIAPSFVGVAVPPGRHAVTFRYAGYAHYTALFGVGAFALLALVYGPRLLRMRSGPGAGADESCGGVPEEALDGRGSR